VLSCCVNSPVAERIVTSFTNSSINTVFSSPQNEISVVKQRACTQGLHAGDTSFESRQDEHLSRFDFVVQKLWDNIIIIIIIVIINITQSVLRQVHSLFRIEFSSRVVLPLATSGIVSFPFSLSSSCLRPPRRRLSVTPIFPSITRFRRQFLRKM
jgi:hypothetical protein